MSWLLLQILPSPPHQLTIPINGLNSSNGRTTFQGAFACPCSSKNQDPTTIGKISQYHTECLWPCYGSNLTWKCGDHRNGKRISRWHQRALWYRPSLRMIYTNIGKSSSAEGINGRPWRWFENKDGALHTWLQWKHSVLLIRKTRILSTMTSDSTSRFGYPAKGDFCEVEFKGADPFVKVFGEGLG